MGDKKHELCMLNQEAEVISRRTISNTEVSLRKYFTKIEPSVVALEAGTHSAWVSRLLSELGHEVLVGNPRKLRVIWDSVEKDDQRDAEMLARIARFDHKLLSPIKHRGPQAQRDLGVIKARDGLVRARTRLISQVRSMVKSTGKRIGSCSADHFGKRAAKELPEELKISLMPLIEVIINLSEKIGHYDDQITRLSEQDYPETMRFREIKGVGPITALAYVLTLENPEHFKNSRSVGAFLGLVPKRDKSGQIDKQLRINKAGNSYLRRLLIGSAQYIMGPFAQPSELRNFGEKIAHRGGKNSKRRAVVAVARKLAVLLHHLWLSQEPYKNFYSSKKIQSLAA